MIRRTIRHTPRPCCAIPCSFVWEALKAFRANQGLLLAGAVAYYALLSIVPLLIVSVIALSHFIDQAELLRAVGPLPGVAAAGPVAGDRRRAVELPGAPRRAGAGAAGHDDLLQLARLHRARKRDGGDLSPPQGGPFAPLPDLGGDALPLHPVPVRRAAAGHAGVGRAAGDRAGERRAVRPQLVAVGRVGRAALPAGAGAARSSC